jgi:hypothetical protein
VYKKYVKQNHLILDKYVEFSPHPKSLDDIDAPSTSELARLGFADVNTTLANTIKALKNAPSKGYTKADLSKLVEEAVNKGATEIRKEMSLKKKLLKKPKYMRIRCKRNQTKTQECKLHYFKSKCASPLKPSKLIIPITKK